MSTCEEKYKNEILKTYKESNVFKNVHEIPCLEKIIIHRGLGEALQNKKCIELTKYVLQSISGSEPIFTKAKKSISNFKLREGDVIGAKITLRGKKMYDFLTKFLHCVLPRYRDFNGLSRKKFDGRGNYNLGLNEDTLFPEVDYDKLDRIRGLDLTFVTNTNCDKTAEELFEKLGFPFKK